MNTDSLFFLLSQYKSKASGMKLKVNLVPLCVVNQSLHIMELLENLRGHIIIVNVSVPAVVSV